MNSNSALSPPIISITFTVMHILALCGCAESKPVASSEKTVSPANDFKHQVNEFEGLILDVSAPLKSWKYIVLHHSATDSGSLESIHKAHSQRYDSAGNPWRGIGYHYVIGNGQGMPDGQIRPTFRWKQQTSGAHAGSQLYNEYGIGICLIGNFEQSGPTSAQMKSIRKLLSNLKYQFGIEKNQILKHGDLKATACPGRLFPFEDIAASPSAGSQTLASNRRSRFSSGEPGDMEEVKNVVSIQRARAAQRVRATQSVDE